MTQYDKFIITNNLMGMVRNKWSVIRSIGVLKKHKSITFTIAISTLLELFVKI